MKFVTFILLVLASIGIVTGQDVCILGGVAPDCSHLSYGLRAVWSQSSCQWECPTKCPDGDPFRDCSTSGCTVARCAGTPCQNDRCVKGSTTCVAKCIPVPTSPPTVAPTQCAFGATIQQLRSNTDFEISSPKVTHNAASAASLLPSSQAQLLGGIDGFSTLAALFEFVEGGKIYQENVWYKPTGDVYVLYTYSAGENNHGWINRGGESYRVARIGDESVYECRVQRVCERVCPSNCGFNPDYQCVTNPITKCGECVNVKPTPTPTPKKICVKKCNGYQCTVTCQHPILFKVKFGKSTSVDELSRKLRDVADKSNTYVVIDESQLIPTSVSSPKLYQCRVAIKGPENDQTNLNKYIKQLKKDFTIQGEVTILQNNNGDNNNNDGELDGEIQIESLDNAQPLTTQTCPDHTTIPAMDECPIINQQGIIVPTSSDSSSSSSSFPLAIVIGSVVGGVIALVILTAAIIIVQRRRVANKVVARTAAEQEMTNTV